MKRTGPLIFALVTVHFLYLIGVFSHSDWSNSEVVEIIHRNWPYLLEPYKVNLITDINEISDTDRSVLRGKNTNSCVTLRDGTTYSCIGGGVTASGYNVKATLFLHVVEKFVDNLRVLVENFSDDFEGFLNSHGFSLTASPRVMLGKYKGSYTLVFIDCMAAIIVEEHPGGGASPVHYVMHTPSYY